MSDTSPLSINEQDADVWENLEKFSQLPEWLSRVKDSNLTLQELTNTIPEFRTGKLILKKCKIGHMLLTGPFWTGTCQLEMKQPDQTGVRKVELRGKVTPPGTIQSYPMVEGTLETEGWHAIIPTLNLELEAMEPEPELVGLGLLTNPETAITFLEETLRAANPKYQNLRIQACAPKVVRYKAGDRCTILYSLKYSQDMPADTPGPNLVIAKINRTDKGQTAIDSLSALWNSEFRTSSPVHIPEPLAYHAGRRVYLQGPVPEEKTLEELIGTELLVGTASATADLNEILRKVAVGLASLHQSHVQFGQPVVWEDGLVEISDRIHQISAIFPDLAHAADPFLDRLRQLETAAPPDPLVPSHGTFRPPQVLLFKNEISFIDFDSFCQSEPSNDLSLFLSSLLQIGFSPASFGPIYNSPDDVPEEVRQARFDLLSTICDDFLEVYEQDRPVSRQRLVIWQAAYLFYSVLSTWIKNKPGELPFLMDLLKRFLARSSII